MKYSRKGGGKRSESVLASDARRCSKPEATQEKKVVRRTIG